MDLRTRQCLIRGGLLHILRLERFLKVTTSLSFRKVPSFSKLTIGMSCPGRQRSSWVIMRRTEIQVPLWDSGSCGWDPLHNKLKKKVKPVKQSWGKLWMIIAQLDGPKGARHPTVWLFRPGWLAFQRCKRKSTLLSQWSQNRRFSTFLKGKL